MNDHGPRPRATDPKSPKYLLILNPTLFVNPTGEHGSGFESNPARLDPIDPFGYSIVKYRSLQLRSLTPLNLT